MCTQRSGVLGLYSAHTEILPSAACVAALVTIKLTGKALAQLRDTGKLKLTLTATASTTDHRTATTTVTLLVR